MYLYNAVYFKGKWKNKFDKDETKDEVFYVDGYRKTEVPTMSVVGQFIYGELPNINSSFIVLPYQVLVFHILTYCF